MDDTIYIAQLGNGGSYDFAKKEGEGPLQLTVQRRLQGKGP